MSSAPLNFSAYPQKPHGGTLVNQVVPESQRASEIARARQLPSIRVDLQAVITVEMIATGVLSPVKGFMVQKDYLSVLAGGVDCGNLDLQGLVADIGDDQDIHQPVGCQVERSVGLCGGTDGRALNIDTRAYQRLTRLTIHHPTLKGGLQVVFYCEIPDYRVKGKQTCRVCHPTGYRSRRHPEERHHHGDSLKKSYDVSLFFHPA